MQQKSFIGQVFEAVATAYLACVLAGAVFAVLFMMNAGRQLVPAWALYTSLSLFAVGLATGCWARSGKGFVIGTLFLVATFGTLGMGEFFGAGAGEGNRLAEAQRDLADLLKVFFPLLGGAVAATYPIFTRLTAVEAASSASPASR